MAGIRPLKSVEHFVAMNLGEVQEIPPRAKGPQHCRRDFAAARFAFEQHLRAGQRLPAAQPVWRG